MSKNNVRKQAVSGTVIDGGAEGVSEEELKLINGYTRRKLSANEVCVFRCAVRQRH